MHLSNYLLSPCTPHAGKYLGISSGIAVKKCVKILNKFSKVNLGRFKWHLNFLYAQTPPRKKDRHFGSSAY